MNPPARPPSARWPRGNNPPPWGIARQGHTPPHSRRGAPRQFRAADGFDKISRGGPAGIGPGPPNVSDGSFESGSRTGRPTPQECSSLMNIEPTDEQLIDQFLAGKHEE